MAEADALKTLDMSSDPGALRKGLRPKRSATGKQQGSLPERSCHLASTDVKYLAFEGGGGKGITYLGAIESLEALHVLPINKPAGTNQILGLAGSSAGAITALVLALGFSSVDVKKLLSEPERFNAFFDGPNAGLYRVIGLDNRLHTGSDPGVDERVVSARKSAIGLLPKLLSVLLPKSDDPMLAAIGHDLEGYLYNVIFDRGVFPGFAVPEFFRGLIRDFVEKLGRKRSAAAGVKGDGSDLTFEQLSKLTRVDLVVTGVNVTAKQVGTFSCLTTPTFPVADAVSISMNIPMLFKPVRVDQITLGHHNPSSGELWVDGGVLNNLPIHVFDKNADNPKRASSSGLSGLHPNVLALRLSPGWPPNTMPIAREPPDPLQQPFFAALFAYLGQLADAIMSPSEEGQIRTADEQNQIIELFTGELSTTEFAPPRSKWEWPVNNAKEVVSRYFAQPPE